MPDIVHDSGEDGIDDVRDLAAASRSAEGRKQKRGRKKKRRTQLPHLDNGRDESPLPTHSTLRPASRDSDAGKPYERELLMGEVLKADGTVEKFVDW